MYAPTSDYVHALEVPAPQRWLFVSGTMGLDEHGEPGATLAEQLQLVWGNVREILAGHGMTVDHIVRVTSYLRDAAYAQENAAARVAALGGRLVPTTALVVATLSERWLIELEVVAAA
ncbi:RidA family protein [Solirubrobacter sp. CPCC 204708]|uniref:RidA family protein n=1 Tax=Solirubrobacter deserti TaxID=2282478 RepID=A0ABT4RP94_9ACTN|nr:RidA family protein [Solirubrobacter deserti]MBE2317481.1 RidA family protein [Solirubrobacter deserti]MDA0140341.1 RidA family protein [Solirubrobacter deserti]